MTKYIADSPRIIFHVPFSPDPRGISGTHLRPKKMLKAFEESGYAVDVVMGNYNERKKLIAQIRRRILNGIDYSFLYSESSTAPTTISSISQKWAISPFMDLGFLGFCRDHGIKTGLYYRDIHWRFPQFGARRKQIRGLLFTAMYLYDLAVYRRVLDALFLPSEEMSTHIPMRFSQAVVALPPGIDPRRETMDKTKSSSGRLEMVYIGGLGELYRMKALFRAVDLVGGIKLTLCVREKEWAAEKDKYQGLVDDSSFEVVHFFGKDADSILNRADLFSIVVKPTQYWEFAMPVKLFTYLRHDTPILGTKGTAAGNFIEENDVGWTTAYDTSSIAEILSRLKEDKLRSSKREMILRTRDENTWTRRAQKVAAVLGQR